MSSLTPSFSNLTWTVDELISALEKLPPLDHVRFLRKHFPGEPLESWDKSVLLELSLSLLQTLEESSESYEDFLVKTTASLCRASFEAFVRLFWGEVPTAQPLRWNWHMSFLCAEAQSICERVINNQPKEYDLVVNISPGTSKSSIFSILLPMWMWTRMPAARIISASGSSDLVMDLATKSRGSMKNLMYRTVFPDIEFSEDQDAKGHYRNTLGGERKISTVLGVSPLGFHAHLILVDDPIDQRRARSPAAVSEAREFFTDVIKFRKVDKDVTPLILIMQRIATNDPTHVVLTEAEKEDAFPARHVLLPSELTEDVSPPELKKYYTGFNEDAGRDADGLMDPIRLNRRVLKDAKTNKWVYASQFLQKPVPPGGDMFKIEYFKRRASAPLRCRRVRVWDRACLVAGTMVETIDGPVPIEEIRIGDLVLTRKGYRRVCWSGVTKRVNKIVTVKFDNGSVITGTPDHPVWTEEGGWVDLASIMGRHYTMIGLEKLIAHPVALKWEQRQSDVGVYDLTVEDAHEFFANGILVHNSTEDGGCYTAGVLMAMDNDGGLWVEHCVHGQWEPIKRNDIILATAQHDRARYGRYEPAIWVEREGGSAARDAWIYLVRLLRGFVVKELDVSRMGSKDRRAEPWSAQLAGGNVWLVDNGESEGVGKCSWDINGYIEEHLRFRVDPTTSKRLGGYCDQVDASAEAFTLLINRQWLNDPLRVYQLLRNKKDQGRWIVACSLDELGLLDIGEQRALMVVFSDPPAAPGLPIMENVGNAEVRKEGASMGAASELSDSLPGGGREETRIDHTGDRSGLLLPPSSRHVEKLDMTFADLDPADYQVSYGQPLEPWGRPVAEIQLSREQAKRFWSCALKKHDSPWQVLILADQGGEDRRALSVAMAVADMLRIPRSAIFLPGCDNKEEMIEDDPPNQWVYEITKQAKYQVVAA